MFKKAIYSSVLVLCLSSCGGGGGGSGAPAEENLNFLSESDWVKATCQFNAYEGQRASTTLPSPQLKFTIFNKRYNQALIQAVFSTSAEETQKFVELTGAKYYKVSEVMSELACAFSSFLPSAPSKLENHFRDLNSKEKSGTKKGKSSILGLYLDSEKVDTLIASSDSKASILMVRDADRYTMVHEFMHHLFRIEGAMAEEEAMKIYSSTSSSIMAAIERYNDTRSGQDLLDLSQKFEKGTAALIEVLRSYTLEEIAIEHELGQYFEAGNLKYISDFGRINGDLYILRSVEKIEERFKEQIEDAADSLAKAARENSSLISGDKAEINRISSSMKRQVNEIKAEMNPEKNKARERLRAAKNKLGRGVVMNGLVPTMENVNVTECAHNHNIESLLDSNQAKWSNLKK